MVLIKALTGIIAFLLILLLVMLAVGIIVLTLILIVSYCLHIHLHADIQKKSSGFLRKNVFVDLKIFKWRVYKIQILDNRNKTKEKKKTNKEVTKEKEIKEKAATERDIKHSEKQKYEKRSDKIVEKIRGNETQFLTDTWIAYKKIKKHMITLATSVLLRADIEMLCIRFDYGLDNPADTAVSYGILHSFKGGVLAALNEHKNKQAGRLRKMEERLITIIYEDVQFYPDMLEKITEFDIKVDVSYRIISFYYPILRFALRRDVWWVAKNYVYPYFIKKD